MLEEEKNQQSRIYNRVPRLKMSAQDLGPFINGWQHWLFLDLFWRSKIDEPQ